MCYVDKLNKKKKLIPRLKELEVKYGSRFHPTTLLKNIVEIGQSFFPERVQVSKL